MIALLALVLRADPAEDLAEALRRTRAEASYATAFKGGGGPRGAWIRKEGRGLRPGAGLLIVEVETTGQRGKTPAVRVGDRTWVYSALHGQWMAPDEAGEAGIAHGLANPDDILDLLAGLGAFARRKGEDLEILLQGDPALRLAHKLAPGQGWTAADATIGVRRDAAGRLAAVSVRASASHPQGAARLEADVELGQYGRVAVPDRAGGVEFNPAIREAIRTRLRR